MTRALYLLPLLLTGACIGGDDKPAGDSGDTAVGSDTGGSDSGDTGVTVTDAVFETLTVTGGCGDTYLYAHNEEGTVILNFSMNGIIEEAYTEGWASNSASLVLPETVATVTVEVGTGLGFAACNDILDDDYEVTQTYDVVSGTAELTVTPTEETWESWEMPATADLTLSDVTLTDTSSGESLSFDAMVWTEVSVGWFPG